MEGNNDYLETANDSRSKEITEVEVNIRRDAHFFYIQVGAGNYWEKVEISGLPRSIQTLIGTYFAPDCSLIIETEDLR